MRRAALFSNIPKMPGLAALQPCSLARSLRLRPGWRTEAPSVWHSGKFGCRKAREEKSCSAGLGWRWRGGILGRGAGSTGCPQSPGPAGERRDGRTVGPLGLGQPSRSSPAAASFRGMWSCKSFETLTRELCMAGSVIIINGLCYRISGA